MPVMKNPPTYGLSEKHRMFLDEYLRTGSLPTSARKVGLSRAWAYKFIKKDNVQSYLRDNSLVSEQTIVTRDECLRVLTSLILDDKRSDMVRLKAIATAAALSGWLVQNVKVEHTEKTLMSDTRMGEIRRQILGIPNEN